MKKIILIIFIFFIFLGLLALLRTNKEGINKIGQNQENTEENIVKEYITENIKDIAINEEVLGGTWYVTYLELNEDGKSGHVIYEDGHIESKAIFFYEYNKKEDKVIIENFQVIR